jgi:hypothetical protein
MPDDNYQYSLMDKEIEKFEEFQSRHRKCKPEVRDAMIEEDVSPSLFVIKLNMSSIGMGPSAVCLVCKTEESICCDERAESY